MLSAPVLTECHLLRILHSPQFSIHVLQRDATINALPVPLLSQVSKSGLKHNVFDVFRLKTVPSLESQPLLTFRFPKATCAKPLCF